MITAKRKQKQQDEEVRGKIENKLGSIALEKIPKPLYGNYFYGDIIFTVWNAILTAILIGLSITMLIIYRKICNLTIKIETLAEFRK